MNRLKINSIAILLILLFSSSLLQSQNILEGIVTYHNDNTKPLYGVTIGLYDLNNNLILSTVTNTNGEYIFSSVPSIEFVIRISSSSTTDYPDLMDAFLIHSHVNNYITLDGVEFEAADINNDGNITGYDFGQVNSSIASGTVSSFINWQFEEVYLDYTSRTEVRDTIDLWGTSEGDVDPSWDPSGRESDILDFENTSPKILSGDIQTLDFESNFNGNISGFQLNVEYPANVIDIVNVIGPDENLSFNIDKNNRILNISWLDITNTGNQTPGDHLFSIEVRCTDLSEVGIADLNILSGGMVLDYKGNKISDVKILVPSINIVSNIIEISSYPNPVNTELNFNIYSPYTESFNIKIFDIAGNLISERITSLIETNDSNISIDVSSLKQGQYIYMISNSNGEIVLPGRFFKIL